MKIKILMTLMLLTATAVCAQETVEMSLHKAIDIGLNQSSRGEIINDQMNIVQQRYKAEKVNFYLPDISINGQLPLYRVSESFDNLYGNPEKSLNRRTNLNFDADITMEQSLITGGELLIKGNLYNRESEYPLSRRIFINDSTSFFTNYDVLQQDKQGYFDFRFSQPLLKPSVPKNDLKNKKDDMMIAELTHYDDQNELKKEIITAYFDVIQSSLQYQIKQSEAESAIGKKNIDSIKYEDEIISEEVWLTTSSMSLDANLDLFDTENDRDGKFRQLALLLDMEPSVKIKTVIPVIPDHVTLAEENSFLSQWDNTIPIKKAEYNYSKAERAADFMAGSYGINGNLEANYSIGRGDVTVDNIKNTNNTDSWGVSVNVKIPIWDGGKKKAEVNATRLQAKRLEIELNQAKKSAKAEIANLINKLNVSFKKLDVYKRQIKLSDNKLSIAKYRFEDGQISNLEYLESHVYYLQAQDKYLEELKTYFLTKIDLKGMYLN